MTTRRLARAAATGLRPQMLPPILAMGPCVEEWAPGAGGRAALGAWRAALEDWATAAGLEPWQAANMARTRYPWSRTALARAGHANVVDYFVGRSPWPEGTTYRHWHPYDG